jgi:hypothetical protein
MPRGIERRNPKQSRHVKTCPPSGSPIAPLHLRPAMLAGVVIVEHAGPWMLRMLHSLRMGDNRTRFGEFAERSIAHACRPRAFSHRLC